MTFCFLCFSAKEQTQIAAAVALSNSLAENVKSAEIVKSDTEISLDAPKVTDVTVREEPVDTNLSLIDEGITNSDDAIQTNDLLLAITPDDKCVGIKAKFGMPATFDNEADRQAWLKQATEKTIALRDQIESGACSIESVIEMIEISPNLSEAMVGKLVANKTRGRLIEFFFCVCSIHFIFLEDAVRK